MADDPLFGPLQQQHCFDLTVFSLELLEVHLKMDPDRLDQALKDLSFFRGSLSEYRVKRRDDLWRIREAFKGRLLLCPLSAMLAEESRSSDLKIRAAGNVLTAWVLAAVLRRMRRSPGQEAITAAQNALRLLKKVSPPILRDFPAAPKTMEEVRRSVLNLLTHENLARNVRNYLERIAYLFAATIDDRDAIHRKVGKREGAGDPDQAGEQRDHLSPEMIHHAASNLDWLGPGQDENLQEPAHVGSLEEQAAEETSSTLYVKSKSGPKRFAPRRIAKRRLSQMLKAIGRRQLALAADAGSMTPFEVAHLVGYCLDNVDQGSLPLLLQLIYGHALPLRKDRPPSFQSYDEQLALRIDLDLPSFADVLEEEENQDYDDDNLGQLYLPLPYGTADIAFEDLLDESYSIENQGLIEQHLQAARKGVTRRYRLGRIARYKSDWLKRQGCDAAIIGFLTGETPSHLAQLHYSRIRKSALLYWHRKYLHEALGFHNRRYPHAEGAHGSHLRISGALISELFLAQREQFSLWRSEPVMDLPGIIARHNAFTTYCLMLLYFATGHRPVGNPFERLGDMDLKSGLIWISDKTSSGNRGSRCLILPYYAREQLLSWCKHLSALEYAITSFDQPIIKARIKAALAARSEDQAPLFFYLNVDEGVIEPSVAIQRKALQQILPCAMNWPRHFLRSSLLSRVSGELIDAWMGHAHYGESPFKKTSGLGLADLRNVADEIDVILHEHKARVERGVL